MKVYTAVPGGLVDGWQESVQGLSGRQMIDFHYHDVDEWLTVISGEITFSSLAGAPFRIGVSRALHIPRGEVHRAEAGPQEVEYRMFLPIAVSAFVNDLTEKEVAALRQHLEFPEYEDGRAENGREFFESTLSDQLVFCRASGVCVDRDTFIAEAFVDKNRSSSGSIQVLNKTKNGLLISTVVEMAEADGVRSFMNVRLLATEEDGELRCRLWVNYPQLVSA
jgi:Cupin domain